MIKTFKIVLFLIFSFSLLFSQTNLVPNPSFESYTTCPTSFGQNHFATGWKSYRSSPDYFNNCALYSSGVSVPKNDPGYQIAYDGNAYMGIIGFDSSSESEWEILGAQLISQLNIGTKYFFSMKISLASVDPIWCNAASDHMGVSFSTVPFSTVTPKPLNNNSKLYSNTIIQDTTNWIRFSGSFVSDSNYMYIMIGNFYNTISTNTVSLVTGSSIYASYYFIDDIKFSTDSAYVNYVNSISFSDKTEVYPNPISDFVLINIKEECSLFIYNSIGQKIFQENLKERNENIRFNTSSLSSGLYYFVIENKNEGKQKSYKIVKQ